MVFNAVIAIDRKGKHVILASAAALAVGLIKPKDQAAVLKQFEAFRATDEEGQALRDKYQEVMLLNGNQPAAKLAFPDEALEQERADKSRVEQEKAEQVATAKRNLDEARRISAEAMQKLRAAGGVVEQDPAIQDMVSKLQKERDDLQARLDALSSQASSPPPPGPVDADKTPPAPPSGDEQPPPDE